MAVDFSRTTRALDADGYRLVLIALAVAVLLLLAWGVWFFRAEVGFYQISETARVTEDGTIVAEFPPDASDRIGYGRPALFLPDDVNSDVPESVPVTVTEVQRRASGLRVILVVAGHTGSGLLLAEGTTGRVQVETDRLTPAQLVLRLSGAGDGGNARP